MEGGIIQLRNDASGAALGGGGFEGGRVTIVIVHLSKLVVLVHLRSSPLD